MYMFICRTVQAVLRLSCYTYTRFEEKWVVVMHYEPITLSMNNYRGACI